MRSHRRIRRIRNAFIIIIVYSTSPQPKLTGRYVMYQVSNFSINVHATVGLSFFLRMYAVMLSCALMV